MKEYSEEQIKATLKKTKMITKSAAIFATVLNRADDFKKSEVMFIIETVLDKFEEGLIEGLEKYYEEDNEQQEESDSKTENEEFAPEEKRNIRVQEIELSDEDKKKIDGLLDGLIGKILGDIIS